MASVGKQQAKAGLESGQTLDSQLLAPQGPGTLAGHVPFHCTNYLSCFPLLPPPSPWADPLLPLLDRQSNHRVWKSWVFRRKQSHDPQGEGFGVWGRANLSLGELVKFGALMKSPLKDPGRRDTLKVNSQSVGSPEWPSGSS